VTGFGDMMASFVDGDIGWRQTSRSTDHKESDDFFWLLVSKMPLRECGVTVLAGGILNAGADQVEILRGLDIRGQKLRSRR